MDVNDEYKIIWDNFISLLKNRIAIVSINSWFKNCKIYKLEDGTEDGKEIKILTIETTSSYIREALKKRYLDTIEELMESILGKPVKIKFILEEEVKKKETTPTKEKVKNQSEAKKIEDYSEGISPPVDLPKFKTSTENIKLFTHESNLLPRYTFDNFVVGDSNRLAFMAAKSVAEDPGKLYNPFFMHGKSGLGKTHLMHAIGNYIKEHTDLRVLYITSEQFITDFTSINLRRDINYTESFKNKYRDIDVLMIDDIQYLENAEKTQQEFFHTFNNLYDMNKQIVISSDRSPDDLKLLEERLRTRFSWGLTVNIYPPDVELKKAIIKKKMSLNQTPMIIDDDVIDYIASNSENDVRHIEGAITRLYAYAAMMRPQKIDLQFANEALKDYLKNSIYMDSNITKIQKAVADYYHITVDDLKSKKRAAKINYPRQIAIYLARTYTDESFPKIGLEFGNRSHSTIIHACDKIKEDLKKDPGLVEIIKQIKNNIG